MQELENQADLMSRCLLHTLNKRTFSVTYNGPEAFALRLVIVLDSLSRHFKSLSITLMMVNILSNIKTFLFMYIIKIVFIFLQLSQLCQPSGLKFVSRCHHFCKYQALNATLHISYIPKTLS